MKIYIFPSLLIFLLVFPVKNSVCQEAAKGVIIFHVAPVKSIIYIDSVKQKNHHEVAVTEGKHVLKIWAPNRQLVNETFSVMKDSTLVYVRTLSYTAEYLEYKKKKSSYVLSRTVPPALTVISTVFVATSYSRSRKLRDQYYKDARQAEQNFYSSFAITTLEESKASFNKAKEGYEKYRNKTNTILIAGAIIIPVGITASVYWFAHSRKPHYKESPLLTRVNGTLFLNNQGGAAAAVSYKF